MILDANVVAHWFSPSEFSGSVRRFRGRPDLIAPGVLLVETANVLYKNARGGKIAPAVCAQSIRLLEKALAELVPDKVLLPAAIELALANNHPVYDCLYLALALERHEPLATADKRLASLARSLNIETQLIGPEP
jgi:predicted nucleic acid-binding protein